MAVAPQTPRARAALAAMLIFLPLLVTALFKYLPALTTHQRITSVAILHPRFIGPEQFMYLENDVAQKLHDALAEMPGLTLRDFPAKIEGDMAQEVSAAGLDALIAPTLTIDAGIVQLDLQVIEARTRRVIFKTPYASSLDNYPEMMKAAAAALKRALQ
jgi:hypothetical protein